MARSANRSGRRAAEHVSRMSEVNRRLPCLLMVATGATPRNCSRTQRTRVGRRDCGGHRGRSKTRHTHRTGTRRPDRAQSFPTRRGVALLPASALEVPEASSHHSEDPRAAVPRDGEGPPLPYRGRLLPSTHRPLAQGRREAPGCGPSSACRHVAKRHRDPSSPEAESGLPRIRVIRPVGRWIELQGRARHRH